MHASEVQQLARSTALREITGIFDEGIPRLGQLTVEKECGFTSKVVLALLAGPIESDLAARRPILGELVGPRQLQAGVVAVTRDGVRSAGKAQEKDG